MKFFADSMLGRLARWLRLLGFDTLYVADISDQQLLRLAVKEGRFILTRDSHFARRGIRDCMLIRSDEVFEQVAQVLKELGLAVPAGRRCANCNGLLGEAPKEEVAGSVPDYVYLNHDRFLRCSDCGNLYWEGSQYRRLRAKLREISAAAPARGGPG